jgi:flagellar motor switch protein FliN
MAEQLSENAAQNAATPPATVPDPVPAVAAAGETESDVTGASLPVGSEAGLSDGPLRRSTTSADIDLSHLPLHTRSLLKIPVTVRVTLARQRRSLSEITELGPGTLVKFEKTYDRPLELSIGDLPIAEGEAVKVGDKFGLRIGKIIRPHERFKSVG